jgi:hypothetical protein
MSELVNCDYCGLGFNKKIAEIKRSKYNYCSKKCVGLGKQRRNEELFYSKTEMNGECMEWKNYLNKSGYGVQRHKGKIMLAHRVSYEISYGDTKGLQVLHKCDNPKCVNPEHLFLGTHQDNMTDMIAKGRKRTKLEFKDVEFIRSGDLTNKELADKFNVSERTIRYAKHEDNWKPLPPPPSDKGAE